VLTSTDALYAFIPRALSPRAGRHPLPISKGTLISQWSLCMAEADPGDTQVSSTSPITALISTKTPISSIVTVHLDGRQDWVVAQRQGLLAWTGLSLSLKPQYNTKLGLAHWGNTYITGRGLLALAGSGQIYQVQLKAGESYVAHPRSVPSCSEGFVSLTMLQ
jgi:hypothetical protein